MSLRSRLSRLERRQPSTTAFPWHVLHCKIGAVDLAALTPEQREMYAHVLAAHERRKNGPEADPIEDELAEAERLADEYQSRNTKSDGDPSPPTK